MIEREAGVGGEGRRGTGEVFKVADGLPGCREGGLQGGRERGGVKEEGCKEWVGHCTFGGIVSPCDIRRRATLQGTCKAFVHRKLSQVTKQILYLIGYLISFSIISILNHSIHTLSSSSTFCPSS